MWKLMEGTTVRGMAAIGLGALLMLGCGSDEPKQVVGSAVPTASSSAPVPAAPTKQSELPALEGSAVVRDLASRFLVVADEDHSQLRVVDLPLVAESKPRSLAMPGPAAQAVMLDGRLLVSIRNPSLLVAYDLGEGADPAAWKEAFRTERQTMRGAWPSTWPPRPRS